MGWLAKLFGATGDAPASVPQAPDPTDSPIPQQPLTKPPLEEPPAPERVYTVKQGDTPESIARAVYGNPALWSRIAQANAARLGNPPVLYPGLKLEVP